MAVKRIWFVDNPNPEGENNQGGIPEDDGHQMSQSEIDDLISKLLNQ